MEMMLDDCNIDLEKKTKDEANDGRQALGRGVDLLYEQERSALLKCPAEVPTHLAARASPLFAFQRPHPHIRHVTSRRTSRFWWR